MHLNQYIFSFFSITITLFLSMPLMGQCFFPLNHKIIQTDTNSITLDWQYNPDADSFQVEITKTSNQILTTQTYITYSNNITISNLVPATAYDYRIRTYCGDNVSNWSLRTPFTTTMINQEQNCNLGIKLLEGNCSEGKYQDFKLLVEGYEEKKMGSDISLQEVQIIIDHHWPSDLDIKLTSPSGKTVKLSHHRGLGRDHFGDPDDSNCERAMIFTPIACKSITSSKDSLKGYFLPEENLYEFNDGSSPAGNWILSICDRAAGDVGFLHSIKLQFNDDACVPPPDYKIIDITDESVKVKFSDNAICNQYWIEVVPENSSPGQKNIAGQPYHLLKSVQCFNDTAIIHGLNSGTNYEIYFRTECNNFKFSDNSCKLPFTTLCKPITIRSTFDSSNLCEAYCGVDCPTDSIWKNQENQALNWIVNKEKTLTDETGPDEDLFGLGNYVYVEASDPQCMNASPAVLISPCFFVPNHPDIACDISFHYHLYGISKGTLTFEASADEGQTWDMLWMKDNENDNRWKRHEISLEEYKDKIVQLRFTGLPAGIYGDMALDNITIHADLQLQPKTNKYYQDADNDGFGNPDSYILSCLNAAPIGYVLNSLDCNDNDKNINPANEEIPCNQLDDNCNGLVDDVPGSLEIKNVIITDETCKGISNGKVEIQLQGGFPPFNVSWNDGDKSLVRDNLRNGFYFVTILDNAGCTIMLDSLFVGGRETFDINVIEKTPNTCPGQFTGRLHIEGIGGNEPYNYIWEDGSDEPLRVNLKEGNYTVTVKDNLGCEKISEYKIQPSSTPTIQLIEIRQPSCPDALDGLIRIRVPDGKLPITYQWNNGIDSPNARNIGPGEYNITIVGADGCSNEATFNLVAPPPIDLNVIVLDPVSCPGGKNGSIYLKTEGGTPPFYYNWNNGLSIDKNITNISAGSYTVTVTDSKNCKAILDSIIVSEPPPFNIENISIQDNKCLQNEAGSIEIQISGGTKPYSYFWSNGQKTLSIQNLSSGYYKLTVSDGQNCKHSFTPFQVKSIQVPLILEIDTLSGNACFFDQNGVIGLSTPNAILPVEFHWSTGKLFSSSIPKDTIRQLKTGSYGVTLTDQIGCFVTLSNINIPGPTSPLSYRNILQESNGCFGEESGKLSLLAEGGKSPYAYKWSNGLYGNMINSLASGIYNCTITDSLGCAIMSQTYEIKSPDSIQITAIIEDENCSENEAKLTANIFGGTPPYDIAWTLNNQTYSGMSIDKIGCGIIQLNVKDANSCQKDTFFILGNTSVKTYGDNFTAIFPNPVSDKLYFQSKHILSSKNEISIFSPEGRIYASNYQLINSYALRIDTAILPPGMYFLKINNYPIKRFIKQ